MKVFLLALCIILSSVFSESILAQGFPNPDSMATGQASVGSLDPVWLVSGWYSTAPASPIGLSYISAEVTSSSVSGWVNPTSLPAPQNTANWISNPNYSETTNTNGGYIYFRLPIVLPAACNGVSIASAGNYTLSFSGYVDNTITDVYVNGTSTGFSGGGYSSGSGLNFTLTGPWVAGTNYIDVQTYNTPGSGVNPYGLLLVANATANYANGCPPAIAGDTVICSGGSTQLWVNESGYTYAWSTGSGNDTITVSPTTNTTYTVTVSNSGGYSASSTVNVIVHPLPATPVNPTAVSICIGDSTTLTAGGGSTYLWNTTATTAAITVGPTVSSTYTVTVTNTNNCSAAFQSTVTVNPLPIPAISPPTAQVCNGSGTALTASGGTSYLWSNAKTSAIDTVSPTTATTYTVTVTNANNCSATASRAVTVNALPTPTITPATVHICYGDSTTLTAGGGTSYLWSNASTNALDTVSPTTNTTYTVTVTNANNCSATASRAVTVNALPTPAVSPPTAQVCIGSSTTLTASGGTSYVWSDAKTTAIDTVSPLTNTTYTVTVTNANNCSATASRAVTVNALPTPTINPSASSICIGFSDTLAAGGGTSYLWSNGSTTAIDTVTPTVNTTYTVTVTNANNCSATISGTVTVNALPAPSINPPAVSICTGDSTVLTAGGGVSYVWSNAIATSIDTVAPTTNTTYTVTVTDANHCSATTSSTVSVNSLPTPSINPAIVQICSGDSTTLTASGGTNYLWSNAATTAAITVSPTDSTTYTVTASNGNNCSATATGTVTVNVLPIPTINPPTVSICIGYGDTLVAGGGTSYLWSNGATTRIDTVSPAVNTTYTVTVTNANNCSATISSSVTVNALPTPTVNPTSVQICNGASTTLTAGGGTNYLWSDSDITNTTTVSPTTNTTYTVTVINANNCSSVTSSSVTVNALPTPNINPTAIAICTGTSTTLTASGGTSYLWSNNDVSAAINVSPGTSTTYTVTVTNVNNCTATTASSVTVNALPTPAISTPAAQICTGASTVLTASGGTGYLWTDATTTDTDNVSPTVNTTYTVTVTNANNCTASTSETVTVIPTMILSPVVTNVSCYGGNDGEIDLSVTSGLPTYSYLWSNTATTQNISNLTSGSYSVTVTDHAGCTATISDPVPQPPLLTVTSTYNNPTCVTNSNDGSITLNTGGGTPPYQFIWSNGSTNETLSDIGPGSYTVTVSDANNCTAGANDSLTYIYDFSVQATPAVTITLGDTAVLLYTLTGYAGNVASVWSPAQSLSCSDCVETVARPDYTTQYQVEVTNDSGCKASDTVTVFVTPNYSVYIPNAFTPNGDGINDTFRIYGSSPNIFAYIDIQIFDRWGEMVFKSNDLDFGWDGTYKGIHLASGVYIYQVVLTFIDGHSTGTQKGSLSLIR